MKLRLPKQLCAALVAAVLTSVSQQTFADTTVATGETLVVDSGTTSSQFGTITVQNGAGIRLNDGATVDARFSYDSGAHISLEVSEDATATWNAAAHPNTAGTGVSSIVVGSNATLTVNSSDTADPAFVKGDVDSVITLNSDATLISNNALSGWSQTAYTTNRTLNLKSGSTWQVKGQEWLNNTIINLEGGNIELSALMNFERNLSSFHVLSSATAMSTITGSSWLNLGGGNTSRSSTVNGHQGDLFDVARGNFELDATNRADLEISAKIGNAGTVHTSTLIKAGNGVLRLTNTNSDYDRGTYIDAGTLISVGAALGTGSVEINQGALLQIESTTAVNNGLAGAGRVEYTQNFSGDFTYTGNASAFTGTLALKRDESGHGGDNQGGGILLSDTFAGVVELQGRAYANNLSLGNAQKLVLNTDGVQNTTGLWAKTAVTLDKEVEIVGSGRSDIFLSADMTLSQNLKAAAGTTLGIKNGSKLILNGTENAIGNLAIDNGKVQVSETATLTFVNTLNGGSLNLTKVIGTGTIALTEQHGIASGSGSYAQVTLDSGFIGTLHYQGGMRYDSNLGGAAKVVFGGTSNICFNSSAAGTHTFSKNIELETGTILGLSTWGDGSNTSSNVVSGKITGDTDTIIRKVDGGAITVSGDLSDFHGTFEMNAGNYGFVIDVADGDNNSTDATFKGGLELRKTGAGNLTLSGSIQSNVKNLGDGSLILTGTLAAGKEIRNESTNGNLVLDNATLGSGNGRLNIKGGTITFRTGITDNTEESNKYAVTVEGNGTADFTDGTFDFSSKNLAAWDGSTIKANSGSILKVGALFWSPGDNYGNVAVEKGGQLIVGAGTSPVISNGQSGKVRVKNFTNKGESALHGFTNINNVSNEGTLSLLGTESKTFGTFTQRGEEAELILGAGLTLETSKVNGGSIEGSYDLGANAMLNIKQLGAEVTAALKDLTLATNATMGVYQNNTTNEASEANISVSGTLTANQHATLNANLTMKDGSTIDVDYAHGGLTMGSTVTFEQGGKMNLSDDIINGLNGLITSQAFHSGLTLFSGVDSFNINGAAYDEGATYAASDYFNLTGVTRPWDFVVKFGDADAMRQSGSGQSIYLWMETPEPATATLSLLALAALAARRKRK